MSYIHQITHHTYFTKVFFFFPFFLSFFLRFLYFSFLAPCAAWSLAIFLVYLINQIEKWIDCVLCIICGNCFSLNKSMLRHEKSEIPEQNDSTQQMFSILNFQMLVYTSAFYCIAVNVNIFRLLLLLLFISFYFYLLFIRKSFKIDWNRLMMWLTFECRTSAVR